MEDKTYVPSFTKKSYIDDNFDYDNLNLEAIYSFYSDRMKESLTYKVLSEDVVPKGLSRLVEMDYDSRKVYCGVEKAGEVLYKIIPDREPCKVVENNLARLDKGSLAPFENVPVSEPFIPLNKVYNPELTRSLEKEMIRAGCKIVDPTPGQVKELMEDSYVYSDQLKEGYYFDRGGFVSGTEKDLKSKAVIMTLQFNPFNLLSLNYVVNMNMSKWVTQGLVTGKYRVKGIEYKFHYSIHDVRYRVHSDNWLMNISLAEENRNYYSIFDLVSTKPFDKWFRSKPVNLVLNTNVMGSIVSTKTPLDYYSVIGPWIGENKVSVEEVFYSPANTPRLRQRTENKSRFTQYKYTYLGDKIQLENGDIVPVAKGKIIDARYYLQYDSRIEYYRARSIWKRKKDMKGRKLNTIKSGGVLYKRDPNGKVLYYELPIRVRGAPVNKYGCLVPDFQVIDPLLVSRELCLPEIDRKMEVFRWARGMRKEIYSWDDEENEDEVVPWTDETWTKYKTIRFPRMIPDGENESDHQSGIVEDEFERADLKSQQVLRQKVIRGEREVKEMSRILESYGSRVKEKEDFKNYIDYFENK